MRKLSVLLLCLLLPLTAMAESWQIAPYSPSTLEIASNRHTQIEDARTAVSFLSTDGFEQVAQNEQAALYLNREYHTLRLVDLRSGYVWGAIPLTDARSLNQSWKSYAASILSIECFDKKNNEKRYGMANGTADAAYTFMENGFDCAVTFPKLDIGMTVSVRLNDNRITFSVDDESIWESGEFKLKSIAFMPYLGCVYEDETPGWFLLPDGPGALMRFQKSNSYVAGYDKRIYGNDLAVSVNVEAQSLNSIRPDDYVQKDEQILMPVYGVVHGVKQNGFLCTVDSGALYASIVATPAGLGNTMYNSIMARFEVRQKYNMSTNQSGAGAAVPQQDRNRFSPALTIHLMTDAQANYDGMAVYYRDLLSLKMPASYTPAMRVEILCAQARESYLPGATATLTTLSEAREIVQHLQEMDMRGILLILSHYTKNNLPAQSLSTGTPEELEALYEQLKEQGGRLLLWLDPVSANEDQINLRLQAAHSMGLSPICITRNNSAVMYPNTYFFRPDKVIDQMEKAERQYEGYSFAVDQAGYRIYGDYTTGRIVTRKESDGILTDALERLNIGALYSPNQPHWADTDVFLDMPLVSGQYLYETDTVPFLPIVLSGSMQMYASSMNLNAYSKDRMLRMLEYGVMPSFTITASDNRLLAQTALSDYSSTCFTDWSAFMAQAWAFMQPAMEKTCSKRIESHQVEAQGRISVTFEDGIHLYINYTDEIWHMAGNEVQPHDYLVKEVSP